MEERDALYYLPLYREASLGHWTIAKKFFDENPEALVATISFRKETALHVAIASGHSSKFVQNLVDLMGKQGKHFHSKDVEGNTPLHTAAIANNVKAAKLLVCKDPSLHMTVNLKGETPLVVAALRARKSATQFLYSFNKDQRSYINTDDAAFLLGLLIADNFFDIAIDLLQRCPAIALKKNDIGQSALDLLAQKPHACLSRSLYAHWQHILYKIFSSAVKCYADERSKGGDIENLVGKKSESYFAESKGGNYSCGFLQSRALELVKLLISEVLKSSDKEAMELLGPSTRLAAKHGTYGFVREVIKNYPTVIMDLDEDGRNIFHLAVEYRQEEVYNLLHQMGSWKYFTLGFDKKRNSLLHLAARSSPSKIKKVPGAALQLQRELQWYKEVEQLVQLSFKEKENAEKMEPAILFIESHKDLREKGEEWMNKTAESCSVVATLVVAIVFAAALTVPGDKDNFINEIAYKIFVVTNAFALFSSSTSMLMLLGMLTSRYSMENFVRALPMRLAIGLIALFISITSMVVAFSAAFYIVLAHQVQWIAVLIGLMASIPVILFVLLQFPLVVEIISSTFGPSIFDKKGDRLL